MAELKTKATKASVKDFINSLPEKERRDDCLAIVKMMQEITGEKPKMWGPSIIGFGSYTYKYASGHGGEMPATSFSPRKNALTLYIWMGFDKNKELMAQLGKFKTAKSCLYIKRLSDVDVPTLKKLIKTSHKQLNEYKKSLTNKG